MYEKSTWAAGDVISETKANNWESQSEQTAYGWQGSTESWAYYSTVSVSISGDMTTKYWKGQRISLVQSGSTKFFYNVNTNYDSTNTIITVIENDDYALSTESISDQKFSNAISPQGFPDSFNWTPTVTGLSTDPVNGDFRFNLVGGRCALSMYMEETTSSTSDSSFNFSLPYPVSTATVPNAWISEVNFVNSGSQSSYGGFALITTTTDTVQIYATWGLSGFGIAGTRRIITNISYDI